MAGIFIHKYKSVPTHGIYFILKFCPVNDERRPAAAGQPSPRHQAKHQNLAMGPDYINEAYYLIEDL